MTTTKAQHRAMVHLLSDPRGVSGTALLGSGALLVKHANGTHTVIERDGRMQA